MITVAPYLFLVGLTGVVGLNFEALQNGRWRYFREAYYVYGLCLILGVLNYQSRATRPGSIAIAISIMCDITFGILLVGLISSASTKSSTIFGVGNRPVSPAVVLSIVTIFCSVPVLWFLYMTTGTSSPDLVQSNALAFCFVSSLLFVLILGAKLRINKSVLRIVLSILFLYTVSAGLVEYAYRGNWLLYGLSLFCSWAVCLGGTHLYMQRSTSPLVPDLAAGH